MGTIMNVRKGFERLLFIIISTVLLHCVWLLPVFASSSTITCNTLDGAYLFSQETPPVYLGFFGNSFASGSINNTFGDYGSTFGSTSIRNSFSTYGQSFGMYSAKSTLALYPPEIYKNKTFIGYLTENTLKFNSVSLSSIDDSCVFYSFYYDDAVLNTTTTTTVPTTTITIPASGTNTNNLFILDIDKNGKYDALTDGLLVMRYINGIRGSALINGVVGSTAQITDVASIEQYLASETLDVNGSGSSPDATDGLLILRYLFGFKGDALTSGVTLSTRDAAAIEQYLDALMPALTAQTITTIPDQTMNSNTVTSAINFMVGDMETTAANLTVTGNSSNTTLIPNANIVFGGSPV